MAPTDYRTVLVLGLGKSGFSAASMLLEEGSHVMVIDAADSGELRRRAEGLNKRGAKTLLGWSGDAVAGMKSELNSKEDVDICVISPGVPLEGGWVRELTTEGIDVVSEFELGASRCSCPVIGVTGTNGKSTAVKLCAEALEASGVRARAAGNYGVPMCEVAGESHALDWIVAEVSSFQLQAVQAFHPSVGVLLNIQPDHLDRHGSFPAYAKVKARMFSKMGSEDTAVVPLEEAPHMRELAASERKTEDSGSGPCWITFGATEKADFRGLESSVVYGDAASGDVNTINLGGTVFANPVMSESVCAVAGVLAGVGLDPQILEDVAARFEPLPHRMQVVAVIRGVKFIDDSKATNLSALLAAVRMTEAPIRLIAGGLLKEKDLEWTKEVLANKVEKAYVMGAAEKALEEAWGDVVPCVRCGELNKAVEQAWEDSRDGDVVLLSPGCASFDQFESYEQRGQIFSKHVMHIEKEV